MTVPGLLMQSQLHLQVADGKHRSTNHLATDRRGTVRDPGIAHLNHVELCPGSSPAGTGDTTLTMGKVPVPRTLRRQADP